MGQIKISNFTIIHDISFRCIDKQPEENQFYCRYYIGHKGKFGHEFLEFELKNGLLRYANNSKYKGAAMIRKNVNVSQEVLNELQRIIKESEIIKEDDSKWPEPNNNGRQELEIVLGNIHISFATTKLGSLMEVQESSDPEGLKSFYYLSQDLRCFVFSLISLHFRIKPYKNL